MSGGIVSWSADPQEFIAKVDEMKAASVKRKALLQSLQAEVASRDAEASRLERQLAIAKALRDRTSATLALLESDGDRIHQASQALLAVAARFDQRREVVSQWVSGAHKLVPQPSPIPQPSPPPHDGVTRAKLTIAQVFKSKPVIASQIAALRRQLADFNEAWPDFATLQGEREIPHHHHLSISTEIATSTIYSNDSSLLHQVLHLSGMSSTHLRLCEQIQRFADKLTS